jgi:pilus assembly protein CpaE
MAVYWLRQRAIANCEKGVSALEFAIFAPMLCLGLLAMIDVGMSVALRMELDRNVRSGAQAAITLDNPALLIEGIVELSAGNPDDLTVRVDQVCFCRIDGELRELKSCELFCYPDPDNEVEPLVFFEISATRPYTGPIFKERTILSETRVQIR